MIGKHGIDPGERARRSAVALFLPAGSLHSVLPLTLDPDASRSAGWAPLCNGALKGSEGKQKGRLLAQAAQV